MRLALLRREQSSYYQIEFHPVTRSGLVRIGRDRKRSVRPQQSAEATRRRPRRVRDRHARRVSKAKQVSAQALDRVADLMNKAMVAPAEHGEVRERRRPSLGPVANVMPLSEAHETARKTTTVVAMLERAA